VTIAWNLRNELVKQRLTASVPCLGKVHLKYSNFVTGCSLRLNICQI